MDCLFRKCCFVGLWLSSMLSLSYAQEAVTPAAPPPTLWERRLPDFTQEAYSQSFEALLIAYEAKIGHALAPGSKRKVALKVDTAMGEGLSTPKALTRAVILALTKRGFENSQIMIFDLSESNLRAAGYLPPLSEGISRSFEGCPVATIDDLNFTDPQWFYESALPPPVPVMMPVGDAQAVADALTRSRRSYLAVPLCLDVDFWINLPVGREHPSISVAGALTNGSLNLATNTARFWQSPAYGPTAVAEIGATPELKEKCIFTILSLERYQYVGGLSFNSLYTVSEKRLWLSSNPVWMDYALLNRINYCRKRAHFAPYEAPRLFAFAKSVGLGEYEKGRVIELR